jgi:hypothetical protein
MPARILALLTALSVLPSCGSKSKSSGFADGNQDAGVLGDPGGGGGLNLGDGGTEGLVAPGCPKEAAYVYVIDVTGTLYRFDPPNVKFTPIGPIGCSNSVFSMSVDRNAIAWVLLQDGRLMRVDTRTAACTPTSFAKGQQGFADTFGMGFSANAPGATAETLFVSGGDPSSLASIDIAALRLSVVGPHNPLNARAELTGTGDARLFGAFEGRPYVVAEIDKSTGKVVSQAPQTNVNYAGGSSNFAFAFWGGDFYLFVGPGGETDVYRYRPSDKSTIRAAHVGFAIVGAGVSTCAPTAPPR